MGHLWELVGNRFACVSESDTHTKREKEADRCTERASFMDQSKKGQLRKQGKGPIR